MRKKLRIAVSKGRILEESTLLFNKIGINILDNVKNKRNLILHTNDPYIELLVIRNNDIATYLEEGIVDLAIWGKDYFIEHAPRNSEILLNLDICKCKLIIASNKNRLYLDSKSELIVATKYLKIADEFYRDRRGKIKLVKLNGGHELAPITGLSDVILDIVESGKTLEDHNLEVTDFIMDISALLIVNITSLEEKNKEIMNIFDKLCECLPSSLQKSKTLLTKSD